MSDEQTPVNMEELQQRLKELAASISEFKNDKNNLPDKSRFEQEIAVSERAERELVEEYTRKISAERQRREEARQGIAKIAVEAAKIENMIEQAEREKAEINALIAAQQKMAELWDSISDIFADSKWGEFIKDYQKEDVLATVQVYEQGKQGILNANVMGAGKTFESAASLEILTHLFYKEHGRKPRVLWLTRKSLTKSTGQELMLWNDNLKFAVVQGPPEQREMIVNIAVQNNLLVVANYEALNSTPALMKMEWDFIFMDECHKLKGGESTKVFNNTREITKKARFFLGLSGSPIQNKPEDIWPIFHILDPVRHPSVNRFKREFVREIWDDKKKQYVQGTDEQKLLRAMRGQVIKQDPAIIQASWPEKRRIFRPVELLEEQRAVYDEAKQGIIAKFKKQAEEEPDAKVSITSIIAQLTRLRQINVWPAGVKYEIEGIGSIRNIDVYESAKIDEAESLLEELIDEGEQVVVWSAQFKEPLKELSRRCRENGWTHAVMDGDNTDDHENIESLFQQGEIQVLLCNRQSVSEGFNFQKNPGRWEGGAKTAIFLDQWWNPKANEQAEDRIWRVGANQPVKIYYILAEDTVDAFIAAKLEAKEAMIDGIMNSETLRPSEIVAMLEDLI